MTMANGITRFRLAAAILVAVLAIVIGPGVQAAFAQASGPGPGEGQAGPYVVVDESDVGDYHVKVWQSPERLVVSEVQVIVELTEAASGNPVDDARVDFYGTPPDEGKGQYSPALNTPINPQYYEATLTLGHAGLWAFDVDIDGSLGQERLTYGATVNERTRSGSSLALGTLMFALVGLAFAGGITFLWWSGRRNRRRMAAQGRS